MFLAFTIGITPVEQYVAREATAQNRVLTRESSAILMVVLLTTLVAGAFTVITLDRLFLGLPGFIWVSIVMVFAITPVFVGRGLAVGQRRFDHYGLSLILEGVGRLAFAWIGLQVVGGPVGLAWGIAFGPLLALLVPSFAFERRATNPPSGHAGAFLAPYIGASSASQVMLAGAPLAVAALGATPVVISVIFGTISLFRLPVSIVYLIQGKLLNLLVRLRMEHNEAGIARIRRSIKAGGLVTIGLGSIAGWTLGPDAVATVFGDEFRPSAAIAALIATGMAGAVLAQLLGQLLVSEGRTATLARRWAVGLLVATGVILVGPGIIGSDPAVTVSAAFAAGELSAAAAMARGDRRGSEVHGRRPPPV